VLAGIWSSTKGRTADLYPVAACGLPVGELPQDRKHDRVYYYSIFPNIPASACTPTT